MEKVNLSEKMSRIPDMWRPRIVAELNDTYVKLVRMQGDFVWHHHEMEDELFMVIKGTLRMQLRDRDIILNEGELLVVPRGVEHRPVAEGEVEVLLLELKSTLNTGNVQNERTVAAEWI